LENYYSICLIRRKNERSLTAEKLRGEYRKVTADLCKRISPEVEDEYRRETFEIKEFSEILKMKTPRYRVFKSKTSPVPAFSTNWKFLAQCYVSYFCKNYVRIEKFVGGKYQIVLEIAYAIVVTNN
jgi:hypothetical protein